MSKIGQKPIEIPSAAAITVENKTIRIKSNQGELSFLLPEKIEVEIKDNILFIKRLSDDKKVKALHGLYRQLIYNAIVGVEKPWEKRLEIVGTGYNVKLSGEDLVLKLGYSHPVVFKKVTGIKFQVKEKNKVIVSGCDKQLVGQIAHQIKMLKKPDPYKGKGVQYEGERLRIKAVKKDKGVATASGAA